MSNYRNMTTDELLTAVSWPIGAPNNEAINELAERVEELSRSHDLDDVGTAEARLTEFLESVGMGSHLEQVDSELEKCADALIAYKAGVEDDIRLACQQQAKTELAALHATPKPEMVVLESLLSSIVDFYSDQDTTALTLERALRFVQDNLPTSNFSHIRCYMTVPAAHQFEVPLSTRLKNEIENLHVKPIDLELPKGARWDVLGESLWAEMGQDHEMQVRYSMPDVQYFFFGGDD